MDMVEVSFSLEPLPPLLTSISESLTLYLTSSQYNDSIGLVTMNPLYDQRLPVYPPVPDVKPTLKRKATSPVQNSGPKKGSPPRTLASSSPSSNHLGSVIPQFGTMPDGRPICPICHMTFAVMAVAKRHFQAKHSGIVFKCEICGAEIGRKDKFKAHLMSKHSMSTDTAKFMADKA